MFDFIISHVGDVFALIGGIVSCASIVVKLTPTTKDDSVLEKVINVLDYVSVFNTKKNQEKLDK